MRNENELCNAASHISPLFFSSFTLLPLTGCVFEVGCNSNALISVEQKE